MLPSRVEMLGVECLLFEENRLRFPCAFVIMERIAVTPGELIDAIEAKLRAAGVGRGCTIAMAPRRCDGISVVVTPPGWHGPEWSPTLDRRWRALEVLAEHGARRARLARDRYQRRATPIRRRPPRSLIPYGASALGGRT